MDSNTYDNTTSGNTQNTQNPPAGDKTRPHPSHGASPVTGRTGENFDRNEQKAPESYRTNTVGTGGGLSSGANIDNAQDSSTGHDIANVQNTTTDHGVGPNPSQGTNAIPGRPDDHQGNLGPNEQQATRNTHNPLTGDKTGPHPHPGTNSVTRLTHGDNLGRNERASDINAPNPTTDHGTSHPGDRQGNFGPTNQQPTGYTGATGALGTHAGPHTGIAGDFTSGSNTHNTHNPLTGDGVTNTHNPMTGDKTGPHPASGPNPVTGRTNDDNIGRREQPADYNDNTGARTGTHTTDAHTGDRTNAGAGLISGTDQHNTHNPLTGGGDTNTHNPLTGDKTGPHPPPDTNPLTGRTHGDNIGRNEQQASDPRRTGASATSGVNAPNPATDHRAGHPGDRQGNLGPTEQQPTDYTGATGRGAPGSHASPHTGAGGDLTSGPNPLTGDGVTNTHNPMTGDKTGTNPASGTNPVTGHTNDGNLDRREQPADYNDTIGGRTGTHTTEAHLGDRGSTGAGPTSGNERHNTHNPLTGGGDTNTHNPLTGDKTGPHPPPGTNPVTGRTDDGNLGRNEQRHTGDTRNTGATAAGPRNDTAHDTTRGAHATGAGATADTGPQTGPTTATGSSGSGTKAVLGRVEATLGAMLNNSEMHAKGMKKQDEAQAAKLAKEQEGMHGGASVRH